MTYRDIPAEAWNAAAWDNLPLKAQTKVGCQSVTDLSALNQTYRQDFANWFNIYTASAGNE